MSTLFATKTLAIVGNWLRMPFVEVDGFRRIFVDIKFTTWKCTIRNSFPESLSQCNETLKLLYLEDNSNIVANSSLFEDSNFKLASILAANKLLSNSRDLAENEATVSFPVSRAGISLVFYDQGACASLLCQDLRRCVSVYSDKFSRISIDRSGLGIDAGSFCIQILCEERNFIRNSEKYL